MSTFRRHARTGTPPPADPEGEALGRFLAGLLDGVDVELEYAGDGGDDDEDDDGGPWEAASVGPLPWTAGGPSALRLRLTPASRALFVPEGPFGLPPEFAELRDAAARALGRISSARHGVGRTYPSVVNALHDVVVAEILAETAAGKRPERGGQEDLAFLVSDILAYLGELAGSRVEGRPLTHGVVVTVVGKIAAVAPSVRYPDDLRALKRTPLLFDGIRSVIAVDHGGAVLTEVTRRTLDHLQPEAEELGPFEQAIGYEGALVAAASRAARGVGLFLRGDQTIWAFDEGQPMLLRRGGRWKALPLASLIDGLARLAGSHDLADLVARAAVLTSLNGKGAIIAVVDEAAAVDDLVEPKDRYDFAWGAATGMPPPEVVVHRVLDADELDVERLARVAAVDGATVVDGDGRLVAYGAVVRSRGGEGEGARTAAARALSRVARVVLKVSEDGPVSVLLRGAEIARVPLTGTVL